MPAPCGGCPPCCKSCIFASQGVEGQVTETVVSAEDYGCVQGSFSVVLTDGGELAQERNGLLHKLTAAGAAFLRDTRNPLAVHA